MDSFRNWYISNQDAISWFIIGWLCQSGLDCLIRGSYVWAAVQFGIAYLNYKLVSFKMQ
jgi:hypothetical protein